MEKHVYTISPLFSFAGTLAETLLDENKNDPMRLAKTLILMPTKRACLMLHKAFLQKTKGRPVLLPRILSFASLESEDSAQTFLTAPLASLPEAIDPTQRLMLLTRLIMQWRPDMRESADKAYLLAKDLALFLDEATLYGVTTERLESIVPDDFSAHWQDVLEFLKIVTQYLPDILKERGVVDSAERRVLLFNALAENWLKNPPAYRVVAAGSTGSLPTTKVLLNAVASLPDGKLILPGVNLSLTDKERGNIKETHPQYHLMQLLDYMGVPLSDVKEIKGSAQTAPAERFRLVNEALRPFETTDDWHDLPPFSKEAVANVTKLECPDEAGEAAAIALILRRALEDEGKTAALITPDRNLAKRVVAYMKRFGVTTDDSAGEPLAATPLGAYLQLVWRAAQSDFQPHDLLALLKHPFSMLGLGVGKLREMTRLLEKNYLRGMARGRSAAYLKRAAKDNAVLAPVAARLEEIFAPLVDMANAAQKRPFTDFAAAHLTAAELLASSADKTGAERLWTGASGEAATDLFDKMTVHAAALGEIDARQYADLLTAMMHATNVRLKYGMHPRLDILGTMEARLVRPDVMILGSLNEGKWPKEAQTDAWFSRPMRKECGLPLPEHLTGLAAHDFAQSFCAKEVYLTRALKEEGTPSVPSRWLLRLETLMQMSGLTFEKGDWADFAAQMDAPAEQIVFPPPAPKPPLAARPKKLAITKIETLMRDPYSIYARYILGLKVMDDVDAPVSAADFGTMLHDVLKNFVEKYQTNLPPRAKDDLMRAAREAFDALPFDTVESLFFLQRLQNALDCFYAEYECRAPDLAKVLCEKELETSFRTQSGETFTLFGFADRIDFLKDGSASVVDYKTGEVPKETTVRAGYAPQLPLEAALLEKSAGAKVSLLEYWRISGKKDDGLTVILNDNAKDENGRLSDRLFANLTTLINAYEDENRAYDATPDLSLKPKYTDYDHLARYKEWSVAQDAEDADDENA